MARHPRFGCPQPHGAILVWKQTVSVIASLITRGEVEDSLVSDLVEAIKMEAAKLTAELPVLEREMIRETSSFGDEIPNHPGVLSNRS